MAAKHSRRSRKRERQKKRHIPPRHLLEQGRQRLLEEDGRGALDLLRQAQHGDSSLEGLPLLLFCACMLRAHQLDSKGMAKEATAMRQAANEHRTSVAFQALTEADLVHYIRYLNGADALQVYADFLQEREPVPRAERMLADLLVTHQCWEGLEVFDTDHPLRRDAGWMQQAIGEMDAGNWERADSLLQGIVRRSPFASWRLFCKAMLCFNAGDDRSLQQALDLLPEDFALAHTVAEWRRVCAAEGKEDHSATPAQVRQALGTGDGVVAKLADQLRQALWKGRVHDLERLLPLLAEAIYPEDPIQARMALLQIVGLASPQVDLPVQAVHNLVRRLLPRERVPGATAQIGLLAQQIAPGSWNIEAAATYLDQLPVEFPEAPAQALARGRVLEALARSGHRAGIHPYFLPPQTLGILNRLIGERLDDPGMIFVELMMASLEADPDNREGYRFLLDLLPGRTSNKLRIERVLTDMTARFPDDPQPCLELATFYYSKNAYRKAEAALAGARKRAPHDERILDLQAIGYLKSADQSRKQGRFQRAVEDLQRAADLDRSLIAALLRVKHLVLEVVSGSAGAAEVVEPSLDALSPGEQLRMLVVLIHDLEENSKVKNVKAEMVDKLKDVLRRKIGLIDQLGATALVELLAPLPADFGILFNRLQMAPVLIDCWPALLARVDGEDLIALFDILLECGGRMAIRTEIDRRLQDLKKAERDPLLLFYLAVIRYQEGVDYGSRRFVEVLDMVDATQQEQLRRAAVRLARYAHGPLREALQHFKFEMLDMPLPFGGGGGLPPLEEFIGELAGGMEDLDDDDEELFLGGEGILDELDEMEEMIDENGMRGAPLTVLRDFAGSMRSKPEVRQELERIARQCEAEDLVDELSRELHTILFPHKRRKGV